MTRPNGLVTCLIIDDDRDDQDLFKLALEEIDKKFACSCQYDPHLALKNLVEKWEPLPDFIFLDLNMPRMNGKEILRDIKKHRHLKDIPVIIYTTSNLQRDIDDCRELGAEAFITKPFRMADLTRTLTKFFETRLLFSKEMDNRSTYRR